MCLVKMYYLFCRYCIDLNAKSIVDYNMKTLAIQNYYINKKSSCNNYERFFLFLLYPRNLGKFSIFEIFFRKLFNYWYMLSSYKRSMILIQWQIIFGTFEKAQIKICKITLLFFTLFFFTFLTFFNIILIQSAIIFRSQKNNK